MSSRFPRGRFIDFETGDVAVSPMELLGQVKRPMVPSAKIDVFECRVEIWQLGVAARVVKEMESPERVAIWSHAAYGLISIMFPYFEMLGKTLNPETRKGGNNWKDFNCGFCDVYPKFIRPDGSFAPEVDQFRDRIRNGMFHLGYTKNGLWIHHNTSLSIEDFDRTSLDQLPEELGFSGNDVVYLMDPHRVVRTLVTHFPGFVARLRQASINRDDTWCRFERFFDELHTVKQ